MAKEVSQCLFLFLLSLLTICSSGTLVGFSYHATGNTASSSTISFLKQNNVSPSRIRVLVSVHQVLSTLSNSGVSVDLYLNETLAENFLYSKSSAISWLKTNVMTFLPHVNIKSIIVSSSSDDSAGKNELPKLLSTLKSVHSALGSLDLDSEVKVSVAFPLSFIENLSRTHKRDIGGIFDFIKKTKSFLIVEANSDGELSMGDQFVHSVIGRATLITSVLPCKNVSVLLIIKGTIVPSAIEVAEFTDKVSRSLGNDTQITDQIAEILAEVSSMEDFAQKELKREEEQIFPSSRREIVNSFKTTLHDTINPPTTIVPTTPISTEPVTIPPDNPTPTIVTVPATNPVTVMPGNPGSTPILPIPSTTPVTIPSTNPVNPPVQVTNPATTPTPITVPGAQPITNPVTTYPAPAGAVPTTTPVTNPVAPPATTNAPAIPGQSWCVAKTGALDTALQAALDYACGIGGADCSLIQQGASCYNPNTLQNHASFAFNSYYQKNPAPSSCDFGATAIIVNINPSTGSCIYPSSALSSTSPTSPSTSTPTPTPTSTSSSSATGVSGSGTPPTVLNSSSPSSTTNTDFGSEIPPAANTSSSMSTGLQPFIGYVVLVTSFVTTIITLDV